MESEMWLSTDSAFTLTEVFLPIWTGENQF